MIYLKLFFSFLIIGAVSFGGGYGMISLIRETVLSNNWLSEEEFLNFIAVSESTPGPLAVNMATFIGSSKGGILGSFFATLGVILPSFFIILLIAALLKNFMKYAGVQAFLAGIRPCVVAMILSTAVTMFLSAAVTAGASSTGSSSAVTAMASSASGSSAVTAMASSAGSSSAVTAMASSAGGSSAVTVGASATGGSSAVTVGASATTGAALFGFLPLDFKSIFIFVFLIILHLIWKHFRKTTISPILMLLLSAGLGIVVYGIL